MNWFLSLARKNQIVISVFLTHLFFLAMLGADHWMHRNPLKRQHVNVRTFVVEAPAPTPVPTLAPKPAPVAATQKAKPQPVAKKTPPKVEPKKAAAKVVAPVPQEASILSEIEKNLDSITTSPAPQKKTAIESPSLVTQPRPSIEDASVGEQVAALLQETLELPEFGDVKMKLWINRFGILEKLEILETKSQKNEAFLKKRLPELQFPCLNETTSLTIVFSNAR